jgi:hypothetical protein
MKRLLVLASLLAITVTPVTAQAIVPSTTRGSIVGRVTDDVTQKPVQAVAIRMFRKGVSITLWPPPTAYTDPLGKYSAVVDTGEYFLRADPPPLMNPISPTYIAEWFDNVQDFAKAKAVLIASGATTRADFGLARVEPPTTPKGIVKGMVVDDTTGRPIPRVVISFYGRTASTKILPVAVTDLNGLYSAELDTGVYLIRADQGSSMIMAPILITGYVPEWYDNVRDVTKATPVHITPGSQIKANFGLSRFVPPPPVTITGTVTDTLGTPLRRADVTILRSLQSTALDPLYPGVPSADAGTATNVDGVGYCPAVLWRGVTDSLGGYTAIVPGGVPCIALASKSGYLPEYFKEKRNPLQADVILAGGPVTGINFSLSANPILQNNIAGAVKDSAGQGVPSWVVLIPAGPWPMLFPSPFRFAHTDSTGKYSIGQVRTGKYYVLAVPFRGYGPAFYKAGVFGVIRWQNADIVTVSGSIPGIDIGVVPIRRTGITQFAGRVAATDGAPLEGVRVCVTDAPGDLVGFGVTDAAGAYVIEGLPLGQLSVVFDLEGYQSVTIPVTVGQATYTKNDLNQTLHPATPTDTEGGPVAPGEFRLDQNYPNPFNGISNLEYRIPEFAQVKLQVLDLLGREVAVPVNEPRSAGTYVVRFDAGRLASGVYLYRLTAGSFTQTKTMILIR